MDHDDYLDVLADETARFARIATTAPMSASVPSCPEWTTADLLWHLAEVQYFWARIAGEVADPEQVPDLARPADEHLMAVLEEQTLSLLHALRSRRPEEWCWSWDERGESIGWVARRQAHEALIHRVDAELVAGTEVGGCPAPLAADGVDEMLRVFLDGVPSWGSFDPDDRTARLVASDTGDIWSVVFGRFRGTSPHSGTTYDDDALTVVEDRADAEATVTGSAWDLDRWLWGRVDASGLTVEGDRALADRLRKLASIE
ncbi:maleylpyruvate isomerase family mycothiol-dependent enzyme [Egicoccus sp. AB-alg6-2]|uniref:maleylpyruvate isomerase family mycothiol-dependent enzyme n=1 Tax=Egicoccus sp. AB-alg6-2 TaxID=3242692 RepID=UPI00359D4D09